jgi:hypothetical protein
MKIVSIDTETTGLDPESCQILSIGVCIEDTCNILPIQNIPKFHAVIMRDNLQGSVYALNMNKDLISLINQANSLTYTERVNLEADSGLIFASEKYVVQALYNFLFATAAFDTSSFIKDQLMESKLGLIPRDYSHRTSAIINVAGKNFVGFDLPFLSKLPDWNRLIKPIRRVIDPAVLCVDWKKDETLPDLSTCKDRTCKGGNVTHNALEDAVDVIKVLRSVTNNYTNLF